ncbi:MAG: ArsR family transcriptional regulator [Thaumarchaeota archaeon]|nr:ArsR family transcriptional regulator [Nitrososphaerota archaeon]
MKAATEALNEDNVVRPTSIEVLSTDDEKIKSIGEVFTSDTERAILCKVCEGEDTTALDISKSLQLDLGLVVRHLKKMARIGLIEIAEVSVSQKGRPMKIYAPSRIVLIIVPSTLMMKMGEKNIIRSLIASLPSLLVFLTFILTTAGVFSLLNTLLPTTPQGIPMWSGGSASYTGLMAMLLLSAAVGGILALILQSRLRERQAREK